MSEEKVDREIAYFVSAIIRIFFSNSLWRYFGFNKFPKRGSFFDRFISKSRLSKENFLHKEILLFAFRDVLLTVISSKLNKSDKETLIIRVLAELSEPFIQTKLFSSLEDFSNFLKQGLIDYSKDSFLDAFYKRAMKSVDKEVVSQLIAGAFVMSQHHDINSKEGFVLDRSILLEVIPKQIQKSYNYPVDDISLRKCSKNVSQMLNLYK